MLRCTNTNQVLTENNILWLELSNTDNNYYHAIPEGHVSQGSFPFSRSGYFAELKRTLENINKKDVENIDHKASIINLIDNSPSKVVLIESKFLLDRLVSSKENSSNQFWIKSEIETLMMKHKSLIINRKLHESN